MKTWSINGLPANVPIVVEDQLLADCVRGKSRAQYRLYSLCYSFMMSVCIRYTASRDDAEDLLNRSFLKILSNIEKYRKEVPFGLWVRRITINTIIDEYRKNRKEKEMTELVDFDEQEVESDTAAINGFLEKTDAEQLQRLIDHLPEMSRKVLNLFVVDGYGHKEISEMLNISEGTSKWHLNNARTKLKELITKFLPHFKTLAS
ncbi:MAG TPA: RNA polymerase sigma factor [Bacteroidia bacterium]|nr:RNA polymerase sigma factor [Bacteroidia bacterium]